MCNSRSQSLLFQQLKMHYVFVVFSHVLPFAYTWFCFVFFKSWYLSLIVEIWLLYSCNCHFIYLMLKGWFVQNGTFFPLTLGCSLPSCNLLYQMLRLLMYKKGDSSLESPLCLHNTVCQQISSYGPVAGKESALSFNTQ